MNRHRTKHTRLAVLEGMAGVSQPDPHARTVGDLLAAVPDPDERDALTSALVELHDLDARRDHLTTDEKTRASDLARTLNHRLLPPKSTAR